MAQRYKLFWNYVLFMQNKFVMSEFYVNFALRNIIIYYEYTGIK